jgi:hypothetical protein
MWRWACGFLCSAAFAGCGDTCVRDSDCSADRVCSAGACVVPAAPSGDGSTQDALPDRTAGDGAASEGAGGDGPQDTFPADASDAGFDGGSDA